MVGVFYFVLKTKGFYSFCCLRYDKRMWDKLSPWRKLQIKREKEKELNQQKGVIIADWRIQCERAKADCPHLLLQITDLFELMVYDINRAKTLEEIERIDQEMKDKFWDLFKPRR
jgi:hypothetical protein